MRGISVTTEAKPFASLSSGLLARKGAARPAMKPQGFGQMGGGNLEDLGWNDMGFEPPKPAEVSRDSTHDAFGEDVVEHPRAHPTGLTPVHSPVHSQQLELVERLNGADDVGEESDETAELYDADAPDMADVSDDAEMTEADEAEMAEALAVETPVPAVVKAPPAASPRHAPRPRAAPGTKGKAAFTLRLDPDRHLKLRLACAVDGRSAQQLVTDALDHLLERMPDLDGLAEKAKLRG
jgi:hypothetical protein